MTLMLTCILLFYSFPLTTILTSGNQSTTIQCHIPRSQSWLSESRWLLTVTQCSRATTGVRAAYRSGARSIAHPSLAFLTKAGAPWRCRSLETLQRTHALLLSIYLRLHHSPSALLKWDYLDRLLAKRDNHIAILSRYFRIVSWPNESFLIRGEMW